MPFNVNHETMVSIHINKGTLQSLWKNGIEAQVYCGTKTIWNPCIVFFLIHVVHELLKDSLCVYVYVYCLYVFTLVAALVYQLNLLGKVRKVSIAIVSLCCVKPKLVSSTGKATSRNPLGPVSSYLNASAASAFSYRLRWLPQIHSLHQVSSPRERKKQR